MKTFQNTTISYEQFLEAIDYLLAHCPSNNFLKWVVSEIARVLDWEAQLGIPRELGEIIYCVVDLLPSHNTADFLRYLSHALVPHAHLYPVSYRLGYWLLRGVRNRHRLDYHAELSQWANILA